MEASQSEIHSSTEEISQTIPEEEEDTTTTVDKNTQNDSDSSIPDSPMIEAKLPNESNLFREVVVTGGGE